MFDYLIPPINLLCAAITAVLLVRARIRWRTVSLLSAAGIMGGVLWVVVHYEPIQRTIFPFRYETTQVFIGNQDWRPRPLEAPDAILDTVLKITQKIEPIPPEILRVLISGSDREVEELSTGPIRSRPGGWFLEGTVYYDPNYSCSLPTKPEATQKPPPDPSSIPGVRVYRGLGVLLFYAFGPTTVNGILRGAFFTMYHGAVCAAILLVMRRPSYSARQRLAISVFDRGSVLVCTAWYSIWWPAIVVLLHAFFLTLDRAGLCAKNNPGYVVGLPLALGWAGVGGIWLGAALGHAFTIHTVIRRMANAESTASKMNLICPYCGYPKVSPSDRCPECGRIEQPDHPRSARAVRVRRRGLFAVKWTVVTLLLCAPMTLPLVGGLLPSSVVNAIGHSWYQLPWTIQKDLLSGL